MYKVDIAPITRKSRVYLEDCQNDKVYYIYTIEGNCLWWHNKFYRIGCRSENY